MHVACGRSELAAAQHMKPQTVRPQDGDSKRCSAGRLGAASGDETEDKEVNLTSVKEVEGGVKATLPVQLNKRDPNTPDRAQDVEGAAQRTTPTGSLTPMRPEIQETLSNAIE